MKKTLRKATETWIDQFNEVPGSIIRKLAETDDGMRVFDSASLRLVASSSTMCLTCSATYVGDLSLDQLTNTRVPCESCGFNDSWALGRPDYGFPCGWDTLFAPRDLCDEQWFDDHRAEVGKLGFYVFESDDYGTLLGIDAGGFDFYEAYWIPLYQLRGLQWHDTEPSVATDDD
jgi:hypothetical protein